MTIWPLLVLASGLLAEPGPIRNPLPGGAEFLIPVESTVSVRGESPASTETVPAPAGQGAIRVHTGSMCPNRNAVRRDAGTVECRDDFCHGLVYTYRMKGMVRIVFFWLKELDNRVNKYDPPRGFPTSVQWVLDDLAARYRNQPSGSWTIPDGG